MDTHLKAALLDALIAAVLDNWEMLTELDRAIGDADHGINLKRGVEALRADRDRLSALALPEALASVGRTLVMTVGGASGPLFGTFFMELGKALGDSPNRADLAAGMARASAAVAARGKSTLGQKTLLDVLWPVSDRLAAGDPAKPGDVARVAAAAAEATVPVVAQRGRASFLGQRSAGHMDPGACSCMLMIAAVCRVLEEETP